MENTNLVWAEINLDYLAHNTKEVRRLTQPQSLCTAVIKADAYGHGALTCAEVMLANGADRLAVARIDEAMELRRNGINAEILVLGYTPLESAEAAIDHRITLTVYQTDLAIEYAKLAQELGKTLKIHVKVDTGMGRIGYSDKEASVADLLEIATLPYVEIEGIYTHFACADETDKSSVNKQFARFEVFLNALKQKGLTIPIAHCGNSATIIDLPEMHQDMVRAGIILYGVEPSPNVHLERIDLLPVMSWKAKITHVKPLKEGESVSYGSVYTAERDRIVATVPIGYADGYSRILSGKADVLVHGTRCPVIGRICMDQCMVDVTEVGDVKVGDIALLFGEHEGERLPAEELAEHLGTVNYELLCMRSRRLPLVYCQGGESIKEVKEIFHDSLNRAYNGNK